MKLVYGVGVNNKQRPAKSGTREYSVWVHMLKRCYNPSEVNKCYIGCEVSESFKNYTFFYDWYTSQIGSNSGFELDKDLFLKGNREYHEDKCILLPKEINGALKNSTSARGFLPMGVDLYQKGKSGKYIARFNCGTTRIFLGIFPTPETAFQAYKMARENHIKVLANKYKSEIDPRAYDALMAYQVEITD